MGFPLVNKMVKAHKDQGFRAVGLHCQRSPKLVTNNIIHHLEKLKPDFPVTQSGWITYSPTKYLPWAIIFDHKGEMIYAGKLLRGAKKAVEAAMEKAPHYVVGGPYDKQKKWADRIIKDLDNLGPHLKKLRGMERDAEEDLLLENLESYGNYLLHKGENAGDDLTQATLFYGKAAQCFKGDQIAKIANEKLEELKKDPLYKKEIQANELLTKAQKAFRKLPPAGRYTYHIEYIESKDPKVFALRKKMILEYRSVLQKILKTYPGVYSAALAEDELIIHEAPK